MLSEYEASAVLAVSDMEAAKAFYEGKLGFTPVRSGPEGTQYGSGSGRFLVYESAYAGTNQATAIGFEVPEDKFDDEAAALRGSGVDFEEFEMEGAVWEDGVATMEMEQFSAKAIWIRDPDGNIIAVSTPMSSGSALPCPPGEHSHVP